MCPCWWWGTGGVEGWASASEMLLLLPSRLLGGKKRVRAPRRGCGQAGRGSKVTGPTKTLVNGGTLTDYTHPDTHTHTFKLYLKMGGVTATDGNF